MMNGCVLRKVLLLGEGGGRVWSRPDFLKIAFKKRKGC